jgi:hypothetical protein
MTLPRRPSTKWRALLGVLILSASSLSAHPADAKPRKPLAQTLTGPAKADYEAGKLLFGDGDYAGALIKLQSAYDLSHDPRLLYNIATCQKSQRHYAKAIRSLRRDLAEDTQLSAAERKAIGDTIAVLEPFTTRLTVHATEDGAEVTVDDEPLGTTPLGAPLVVDIGERKIRLTKEGFMPFEKALAVGGSADLSLEAKLEKEVHEGHLTVNAPSGSSVVLDEKPIGSGKVELAVPTGGHQLRVTAPGMRPYQSEVLIQDRETRTIEVVLEAEEVPKIRVAVGCGDLTPKGPNDGMVAYLDGNDVLPASGVKVSWDPEREANVLRYAEYPAQPGQHTLRLRMPGCESIQGPVTVTRPEGDDVEGAMELDKNILFKGPQGTPGWGRVGVAFWAPFVIGTTDHLPGTYTVNPFSMQGVDVDVGVVTRWFSMGLEFAYGTGSGAATLQPGNNSGNNGGGNFVLPSTASVNVTRGSLRLGPRFPFHTVALGFGPQIGVEQVNFQGVQTGGVGAAPGLYTELVVQPFCYFGFYVKGDAAYDTNVQGAIASMAFGAIFNPSSACMKERTTRFGMREKARVAAAPPAVAPAPGAPAGAAVSTETVPPAAPVTATVPAAAVPAPPAAAPAPPAPAPAH